MSHGQPSYRIDGDGLRQRRELGGMSLRAFADRCALAGRQIEPSQLSRIERELCVPRPKLLAAMAKVLGVEPSALLRQDSEGTK